MALRKLLCLCFMSLTFLLQAYEASPRCYRDLSLNFFQPTLVLQALSMHRVPQGAWTPILRLVQQNSKDIPRILKFKAQKLNPNPLDPLFMPEPAQALLEETLFEIFSASVTSYNAYQNSNINGEDIQMMFNYISEQQAGKIEKCFGIPSKKIEIQ